LHIQNCDKTVYLQKRSRTTKNSLIFINARLSCTPTNHDVAQNDVIVFYC